MGALRHRPPRRCPLRPAPDRLPRHPQPQPARSQRDLHRRGTQRHPRAPHRRNAPPQRRAPVLVLVLVRSGLRDAMDRFIGKHLLDESLSPSFIASAHGVSVRTVNRIFSASGQTVTDTVRARRLACARAELTEIDRSIAASPAGGVSRTAVISARTFKAHYGTSPTDFRTTRLTDAVARSSTQLAQAVMRPASRPIRLGARRPEVEQHLPLRVQDPS